MKGREQQLLARRACTKAAEGTISKRCRNATTDTLAKDIRSTDASVSGDLISNMKVIRSQEGGPISFKGSQS